MFRERKSTGEEGGVVLNWAKSESLWSGFLLLWEDLVRLALWLLSVLCKVSCGLFLIKALIPFLPPSRGSYVWFREVANCNVHVEEARGSCFVGKWKWKFCFGDALYLLGGGSGGEPPQLDLVRFFSPCFFFFFAPGFSPCGLGMYGSVIHPSEYSSFHCFWRSKAAVHPLPPPPFLSAKKMFAQ